MLLVICCSENACDSTQFTVRTRTMRVNMWEDKTNGRRRVAARCYPWLLPTLFLQTVTVPKFLGAQRAGKKGGTAGANALPAKVRAYIAKKAPRRGGKNCHLEQFLPLLRCCGQGLGGDRDHLCEMPPLVRYLVEITGDFRWAGRMNVSSSLKRCGPRA